MSSLRQVFKKQPVENLREEMKRRASRKMTLLQMFKINGELNTHDLQQFGTGVSSRIFELRKEGHVIVQRYEKPGLYRYVYLGSKSDA